MAREKRFSFGRFAKIVSQVSGNPSTFAIAVALIAVWALSGPIFGFSDTWQLVINTSTTIITFLMVFVIQNTQNRDTGAIQIKLDELLRVSKRANTSLLDLEELEEKEIERLRAEYERLAREARERMGEKQPAENGPGPDIHDADSEARGGVGAQPRARRSG